MIWAFFLMPLAAALLVLAAGGARLPRLVLVAVALGHLALTAWAWTQPLPLSGGEWLAVDALGLLFLSVISLLFAAAALHAVTTLGPPPPSPPLWDGLAWRLPNQSERVFLGCLLLFLSAMSLVTLAQHLGLLWVAVEATTLTSTPLIYYHRHSRSLEAAWKYLLICSVGITLALLGNFFLAVAGPDDEGLLLSALGRHAQALSPAWLKAAFLLMLVGYGTKMGLAPMHTWLPDAHSEAPSLVSALLSGALLNGAFLAILRMMGVMEAAGFGEFARQWLVVFGLLSMFWAAALLVRQGDFKRMLAYSSVEHMGLAAFGIGAGGLAATGGLLHLLNHSCVKAALFLLSGHLLAIYKTKRVADIRGLWSVRPSVAALWTAGILAVLGLPPGGLFVSEWMILKGLFATSRYGLAAAYLGALLLAFAAMSWTLVGMIAGPPSAAPRAAADKHGPSALVAPVVLLALVVLLGLWLPAPLRDALDLARQSLMGGRG